MDASVDIGTNNQSLINSRSGSLSSNSSSGGNLMNSTLMDDSDFQNLNQNFQSQLSRNNEMITNSDQNNTMNLTHKNSIPNIIFTFSGNFYLLKLIWLWLICDSAQVTKIRPRPNFFLPEKGDQNVARDFGPGRQNH